MNKITIILIIATVLFVGLINSVFIVDQRNQSLILQFGEPVRVEDRAGLKFKLPFIQNVLFFDKRIIDLGLEDQEVIASDQKRIIINAFIKYKISDPLKFYTTVRNQFGMKSKLDAILDSSSRKIIGEVPLNRLLTENRSDIMTQIKDSVSTQAQLFGIKVIDVRIMRSDLPKENSDAIFSRMKTEREKEAREIRATGDEEAQKIRARADKEKTLLLAEANKQSQITRGNGEAKSTKIFAQAFGRDPDFFSFYRSMQAYEKSLKGDKTTLVISPTSEFFQFIKND